MSEDITDELRALVDNTVARKPLGQDSQDTWTRDPLNSGEAMYQNQHERLGIDFSVERLSFPGTQTMDPRVVRIKPGHVNERHKHAHESLFVILEGEGEVLVGDRTSPVKRGDVAFVPRWAMHQTRNTSATEPLVVLAITDFGFTSAVLGDYDRRTRARHGGDQAEGEDAAK